jgi:peptidoglycan biosynthesis protein MviN/MurJ (putative lipid II flippase)
MGKVAEYIEYVSTAARYVLFWSLPTIALIIVLRAHMVRTVLGSGSFDWTDTRLTAAVFALLSLSLAVQGLSLLLTRAYYAAGRTFVPFLVAVGSCIGTISLAWGLVHALGSSSILRGLEAIMRLEDVPGSAVLALPVAYAFASVVATCVLVALFEMRFRGFFSRIIRTLFQSCLAAVGAGFFAYITLMLLGPLTLSSTLLSVMLRGATAGIVGIAGAAIVYALLRNREFLETVAVARGRLWSSPAPSAQPISSAEEVSASSPQ